MLDHYGWKWWKHQSPDLDQVRLELVDIMHFAMSDYLLQDADNEIVAARIEGELSDPRHDEDIRAAKVQIDSALAERTDSMPAWRCPECGETFAMLAAFVFVMESMPA